jgi:glycosyltransferase involved in cell wall biosynthesis
MSRNLLGFAVLTLVCIIISPFYKNVIQKPERNEIVFVERPMSIETDSPRTIVLMTDSFLPTTFAGSELSAYETIKYLRARGHTIIIFVTEWKVPEYDGFKIYKYNPSDVFCKKSILESDAVFFQMSGEPTRLNIIKQRSKPVYIFIHIVEMYAWLLQQKVSFPINVVYNSHMTQDSLPTLHNNMRMIPYVDTSKFKNLRINTINNKTVCLINCNKNKGGELLIELAKKMPTIQFIGVKGGYSNQVIDPNPPKNLVYMENQKDITCVFKKTGILIMPSINETWGRTAVEAMASGVPVIHSEAPGLVECVSGAGILCNHNDIDAWIKAIERINSDRAFKEQIRQNGFNRIRDIEEEQIRGRQELAMKIEN